MSMKLARHGQFALVQYCPKDRPDDAWIRFVQEAYACPFCDTLIWMAVVTGRKELVIPDDWVATTVRGVSVFVHALHSKPRYQSTNGCQSWVHPAAVAGLDLLNEEGIDSSVLRKEKNRDRLAQIVERLRVAQHAAVRTSPDLVGGDGSLLVRSKSEDLLTYSHVNVTDHDKRFYALSKIVEKMKVDSTVGARPMFEGLPEFAGELEYEDEVKKRRRRRRGGVKNAHVLADRPKPVEPLAPTMPKQNGRRLDELAVLAATPTRQESLNTLLDLTVDRHARIPNVADLETLAAVVSPVESLAAVETQLDVLTNVQTALDGLMDLDVMVATVKQSKKRPSKSAMDMAEVFQLLLPGLT